MLPRNKKPSTPHVWCNGYGIWIVACSRVQAMNETVASGELLAECGVPNWTHVPDHWELRVGKLTPQIAKNLAASFPVGTRLDVVDDEKGEERHG